MTTGNREINNPDISQALEMAQRILNPELGGINMDYILFAESIIKLNEENEKLKALVEHEKSAFKRLYDYHYPEGKKE